MFTHSELCELLNYKAYKELDKNIIKTVKIVFIKQIHL